VAVAVEMVVITMALLQMVKRVIRPVVMGYQIEAVVAVALAGNLVLEMAPQEMEALES